jgi:threonylcarbamoyladenosine tRNA methylthiotransferase MtaB
MVKIQEGCDQVCAYCIVPKVRGRERSIPAEEIVGRINEHVSRGYNEVVLTGTQLGTYGFDLAGIDLAGLLERILSETKLRRLRVSSLQPHEIDARLLALWTDSRLCPHFHLALQSGSDDVLKRMRRRYTAGRYVEAVQNVREAVQGVSVTTDVIVGFPGETDADFQRTYALCEQVGFAAMHVFPFSARPGTSAAHFGGGVRPEARSGRVRELLRLSLRQSAAFRDSLLGSTRTVLWEATRETMGPDVWVGLTDNYVRVAARSPRDLTNELTSARLYAREEDLVIAQVLQ